MSTYDDTYLVYKTKFSFMIVGFLSYIQKFFNLLGIR